MIVFVSEHVASSGTRPGDRENKCLLYRKDKDDFFGCLPLRRCEIRRVTCMCW